MIDILEAAEEEQLAAARWYEEQRDGLGLRFISEVERVSDLIAERPGIGAPWTYSKVPEGVRRFPLRSFPYHVVYVEEPRLLIVAVAHMKRRPGYWRARLRHI